MFLCIVSLRLFKKRKQFSADRICTIPCTDEPGDMIANHAPIDDDFGEDQPEPIADDDGKHGEFEYEDDHGPHDSELEWFDDTCSENSENDQTATLEAVPSGHGGKRVPAVEKQAEYLRLRDMGLSVRPPGCSLGIHPGSCVWRSATSGSIHFSRSYGAARTSWQALLRVMELMLESYVAENSSCSGLKLVKNQLHRIRKLRGQEPPHQD